MISILLGASIFHQFVSRMFVLIFSLVLIVFLSMWSNSCIACLFLKLFSFLFFRLVVDSVSDIVDYWVTFNEPHIFCVLTYCAGAWPGGHPDTLEVATSALPTGAFQQAMHWMAIAHSKAYDYIHAQR